MSADPSDAEPLLDPIRELLAKLEADLLAFIAAGVAAGWSVDVIRRRIAVRLGQMTAPIAAALGDALTQAWDLGQAGAEDDAPRPRRRPVPRPDPPKRWPAQRVLRAVLQQTPGSVTPSIRDLNRKVTDGMTAGKYGTRKAAAADLLTEYAANGITGFKDTSGRAWDLASYAEVVTRTTTAQTLVDAHTARLTDLGQDLVIVSDSPEECDICREFEGKVLSISGRTPNGRSTVDGHPVTVKCTVAQARSAGFQHPNCRHRLGLYLPGITRPIESTRDPEGAKLRTQQRYREREARKRKRIVLAVEAAAGPNSPEARKARARERQYLAGFADWREQNDRTNVPGRLSLTVR